VSPTVVGKKGTLMNKYCFAIFFALCLIMVSFFATCASYAGDARGYANMPEHFNGLQYTYFNVWNHDIAVDSGGVLQLDAVKIGPFDITLPPIDFELIGKAKLDAGVHLLKYVHYFKGFWGQTAGINLAVPYMKTKIAIDGEAKVKFGRFSKSLGIDKKGSSEGIGDIAIIVGQGFFGGPSLPTEEFIDWQLDTAMGMTLQVTAPTGKYDRDKYLNEGANRWSFKPELALLHKQGKWWFDFYANGVFYTDNEDYHGNSTLSQDPLWGTEAHAGYDILRNLWASLDLAYNWGANKEVDGTSLDDSQQKLTYGATVKLILGQWDVALRYAQVRDVKQDMKLYDMAYVRFEYGFGPGVKKMIKTLKERK